MFLQFAPGAMGLMRNSKRDSKKGDKMAPRWLGPYKVHQMLDKGVCRLENAGGLVLKAAVHQCRLKIYIPPDDVFRAIDVHGDSVKER